MPQLFSIITLSRRKKVRETPCCDDFGAQNKPPSELSESFFKIRHEHNSCDSKGYRTTIVIEFTGENLSNNPYFDRNVQKKTFR